MKGVRSALDLCAPSATSSRDDGANLVDTLLRVARRANVPRLLSCQTSDLQVVRGLVA